MHLNKLLSRLSILSGLIISAASASMLFLLLGSPEKFMALTRQDDAISLRLWTYLSAGALCAGIIFIIAGVSSKKTNAEAAAEPAPVKWSETDLFLISFLVLFLELAFIRWIPAYTRMLSYFSNFVLLSCFLGMGSGCLLSKRKQNLLSAAPTAIFMLTSFTLLMFALNYGNLAGNYIWGGAAKSVEIFMGNDYTKPLISYIPIEFILAMIFILNASIFAGLGQALGQAMETMPPLRAYSVNIAGSLLGILSLTAIAVFSVPAPVWFAVAFVIIFHFVRRPEFAGRNYNLALLCSSLLLIALFSSRIGNYRVMWSPYYKITMEDNWPEHKVISVNEVGHQLIWPETNPRMIQVSTPFLLYKDTHGAPPGDVLIIGSGTGNDVNLALKIGAKSIDAVEIDPVILALGRNDNPMKPYSDPRVTAYTADGRAFLKNTKKSYDLVTFSVLDSLTLFSTYSSLHLESYLFTKESFQDIKKRLRPGGSFVFYNYCFYSWHILRTQRMMQEVFGKPVLLVTFPSRKTLTVDSPSRSGLAIFIAGNTKPIQDQFNRNAGSFTLLDNSVEDNLKINGFDSAAAASSLKSTKVSLTETTPDPAFIMPTDDWPFYYKKFKALAPHDIRGLLVIFLLSLAFIFLAARGEILKFSPRFFFLGAGFMLLEVVSITRLALLYGTTWIVNSVVFFSILAMAYLANLYAIKRTPPKPAVLYPLLFAAIAVSWLVPLSVFVGSAPAVKLLASCSITFLPIIFSGLIFSTSFSKSTNPSAHFGSNLLGVIIGGIAVYIASRTGYRNLLLIVEAIYALSWIAK